MLHYLIAGLLYLHGLIHMMGFAKAFGYMDEQGKMAPVSKAAGLFWLFACIIFILSGTLYVLKKENWWIPCLLALIISQAVIMMSWKDARYGTIANLVILAVLLTGWLTKKQFL